jgi:hypothetical protein
MAHSSFRTANCEEPAVAEDFPEKDWKLFRKVSKAALERFCERILSEIARISSDTSTSSHERYLLVYQLIHDRDAEIAEAFNDQRRSTAVCQLAVMHNLGLLSAEELARFSSETQASVKIWSEMYRKKGSRDN